MPEFCNRGRSSAPDFKAGFPHTMLASAWRHAARCRATGARKVPPAQGRAAVGVSMLHRAAASTRSARDPAAHTFLGEARTRLGDARTICARDHRDGARTAQDISLRWMASGAGTASEGALPPLVYEDGFIKQILSEVRTIAMVGARQQILNSHLWSDFI